MKKSTFSMKIIFYLLLAITWEFVSCTRSNQTEKEVSKDKVKLFSLNSTELAQSDYDLSESNYCLSYALKKDVKLFLVEYDGKEVWKHDPSLDGYFYPDKLRLTANLAYLYFGPFCYEFLYENDKWNYIKYYSLPPTTKTNSVYVKEYKLQTSNKVNSVTSGPVYSFKNALDNLKFMAKYHTLNKVEKLAGDVTLEFGTYFNGGEPDFDKILTKYQDLVDSCHELEKENKDKIYTQYYQLYMTYKTASENGWHKFFVAK